MQASVRVTALDTVKNILWKYKKCIYKMLSMLCRERERDRNRERTRKREREKDRERERERDVYRRGSN